MSNTPRLDDDQALELVQESVASKTPPEIANWDGCRFALVEVDDQLAEDCDIGKVRGSNGRGTAVRIKSGHFMIIRVFFSSYWHKSFNKDWDGRCAAMLMEHWHSVAFIRHFLLFVKTPEEIPSFGRLSAAGQKRFKDWWTAAEAEMIAQDDGAVETFISENDLDANASKNFKAAFARNVELLREDVTQNPASREWSPKALIKKTMADRDLTPAHLAETFSKYKGLVDKLNGGNAPVGHFGPAVSGAVWKGRGKGRSKTADDSPAPVAGPSNAQKGKGGKEKGAAGSSSTTPAKRQAASTGVVDNEDLKKKSKPTRIAEPESESD